MNGLTMGSAPGSGLSHVFEAAEEDMCRTPC
jgi:hypothetical protein